MLHGPCGFLNPKSPCMRGGKCTKNFPKPYQSSTTFEKDGYVHYKMREGAYHTIRSVVRINNGFGVPYTPLQSI